MYCRDLGFNPGIFGKETSDWGSAELSLLIPVSGSREKLTIPTLPGIESGTVVCEAATLPLRHNDWLLCKC